MCLLARVFTALANGLQLFGEVGSTLVARAQEVPGSIPGPGSNLRKKTLMFMFCSIHSGHAAYRSGVELDENSTAVRGTVVHEKK